MYYVNNSENHYQKIFDEPYHLFILVRYNLSTSELYSEIVLSIYFCSWLSVLICLNVFFFNPMEAVLSRLLPL